MGLLALEGLAPGATGRATRLGVVHAPRDEDFRTTAAALHPSGERLLLRTALRVWEVRRPGTTSLEALLQGAVVEVPGASQAQPEALALLPGGRSSLLGSEFTGQPLIQVDCRQVCLSWPQHCPRVSSGGVRWDRSCALEALIAEGKSSTGLTPGRR